VQESRIPEAALMNNQPSRRARATANELHPAQPVQFGAEAKLTVGAALRVILLDSAALWWLVSYAASLVSALW